MEEKIHHEKIVAMLSSVTGFKIKFNEVDALGIVWHGHYIRFFEDGREAFGEQHGLAYMDIYRQGFITPVVNIQCDYKKSLVYGDMAVIETQFVDSLAAKIIFRYKISLADKKDIIAEGTTTQVFLDSTTKQLQLTAPDFFLQWKKSIGSKMV